MMLPKSDVLRIAERSGAFVLPIGNEEDWEDRSYDRYHFDQEQLMRFVNALYEEWRESLCQDG